MSAEQNKALVRRFTEESNKGNLAVLDEVYAPNCAIHLPPYGEFDLEGYKKHATSVLTSFPDAQYTIEDLMAAEGDKVVVRVTFRGTDKGGSVYLGTPPTGKQMAISFIAIYHVVGGKFVETWSLLDALGLGQQLGLIPKRG